jgi:lysophospholipase L1-like esterase
LEEIAAQFRQNYTEPLQSLVERAKTEDHNVVIVVFGLANIDAFFKARINAAAFHTRNPALYPYFESAYRSFESLQPPYQKNMVRLSLMMNAEMRAMVGSLNRELKNYRNIRVQYSDALTKVDFSRLDLINPVDAWHPSVQGHKALADAAFSAIRPSLAFLGVGQRPMSKHQIRMTKISPATFFQASR